MKKKLILLIFAIIFIACKENTHRSIDVFAGSASLPPLNEIATLFTKETGIEVRRIYGGSGTVLSEMILSKRGDIYLPGSPDFMDIAIAKGVVKACDVKIIAYLVPAIIVQKSNPKNIKGLQDLLRDDVTFAIGDPRSVCVGLYAAEILEKSELATLARKKIKTYGESCEKTANLISMKAVDAVIGWDVFEKWNPDSSQSIKIDSAFLKRAAYIPVALSNYSSNPEDAIRFLNFISSAKGKEIYKKYGYITEPGELKNIYGNISIGGNYKINEIWK